ncbi:MAG: aminoacetone oxidase family FAD-binding enzyme [Tepidisphaera sp.]|nr:aminoacetone oxidase family FAD-binding enzyme [Tepidisphaera sp.]
MERADVVVVGAGAAGLFAAVWAGRELEPRGRVIALDGARKLGAKILVAGGGRCNVTHHAVDETAYAGSSRNAVRKVLGRFGVERTVEFFRERGVELKQEDTGKLFPVSDDAHSVLGALLAAAGEAGVSLAHPWRVGEVRLAADCGFEIVEQAAPGVEPRRVLARRVILATGGMALPKTGSDGAGYAIARSLGHSVTERVFPALVPLLLPQAHWLCGLSGLTTVASVSVRSASGKMVASFTNSLLCTHFGLSGPAILDVSRYYLAELGAAGAGGASDGASRPALLINWLPAHTFDSLDAELARGGKQTCARTLANLGVPERLARGLCEAAGVDGAASLHSLSRGARVKLATAATAFEAPVVGDRGFTYAEVTAGGVPLGEVRLETMESRVCPGLHLCGEILDVDGRIGGFNFQWAWATGYVAGLGAARGLGLKPSGGPTD